MAVVVRSRAKIEMLRISQPNAERTARWGSPSNSQFEHSGQRPLADWTEDFARVRRGNFGNVKMAARLSRAAIFHVSQRWIERSAANPSG